MKKKIMKLCLIMTMVFMAVTAVFTISANAAETKVIGGASSGAVYLRKGPGSSSYYTTISNGTYVTSIGWSNGYYQVQYNGYTGWVTGAYVKNPGYYSSSYSSGRWATIAGASSGAVYVWKYSTGSSWKTTVRNGTRVYVTDYANGRYYGTTAGGTSGWFTSAYVY